MSSWVQYTELNQKLETKDLEYQLDKRLKPKERKEDNRSRDLSPHTTRATKSAKMMSSRMKLTYEAIGVVVANNFQGIITIDDFSKLNDQSVEGIS